MKSNFFERLIFCIKMVNAFIWHGIKNKLHILYLASVLSFMSCTTTTRVVTIETHQENAEEYVIEETTEKDNTFELIHTSVMGCALLFIGICTLISK